MMWIVAFYELTGIFPKMWKLLKAEPPIIFHFKFYILDSAFRFVT